MNKRNFVKTIGSSKHWLQLYVFQGNEWPKTLRGSKTWHSGFDFVSYARYIRYLNKQNIKYSNKENIRYPIKKLCTVARESEYQ